MKGMKEQMGKIKKVIIFSFLVMFLLADVFSLCILDANAKVKEYKYSQTDLDIMFVVDCSNSMNANDKNKMALQMIGTLVDTAYSSKTRIGYVEYNHNIISSQKPQEINTRSKRDNLRNKITQIQRSGSTDIGQALKHAKTLLDTKGKQKSIIILISDGETDLTYANTGRTKNDSDKDMYKTADDCSQLGIPIYTIAFSDSYDGDSKILEELSKETKAVSYKAPMPVDLIGIFNEITKGSMMSSIIPIGASMSSGKLQSIKIPIHNNEEVKEANILVVSTTPIEEANLFYKGKESSFHKSEYYFTGKIMNPSSKEATLQLKARADSDIKIYLQLYQDLDFRVKVPEVVQKGDNFTIEGYFYDKTTKKQVLKGSFYKDFIPTIEIIPLTNELKVDKSRKKIKVTNAPFEDGCLKGSVVLNEKGNYRLNYKMKSEFNSLSIRNMLVEIENTAPEGNFIKKLTYHNYEKRKEFNLEKYFSDPNGDNLNFSLVEEEGDSIKSNIEGNLLQLDIRNIGTYQFRVQASDSDLGIVTSDLVEVSVIPIWRYYVEITALVIVLIIITVLLLVFLWIRKVKNRPKPYYSGKLNVYFTRMPDDMEIEPLTFMLYPLETSEVTLSTLLNGAGIDIKQLEGNKIKFLPSFDKKIIFSHNTANNVMLLSSIACKGLKYSMEYGNKIYITSDDEEYEVEIHYVSSRV